jgi:hypothetical protein
MPEPISVAEAGRRGGTATAGNRTPEQRREAAQHAINTRWARVRAQVEESRKAQGLPPTVDDPNALGELAREVLERGGPDGA